MPSISAYDFDVNVKAINTRTRAQRIRAQRQIEAIRTKYEKVMRPQLRTIFNQQKNAIIELESMDPSEIFLAINSNRALFVKSFSWMYEKVSDDILPMIMPTERVKSMWSIEKKDPFMDSYIVRRQEYIRDVSGRKITGINDTTLNMVKEVMNESDNMIEFRNGVIDVFDNEIKTFRANTIARTETAYASNNAMYEDTRVIAEEMGVDLTKTWQVTLDEKVRDTHMHLDGKTIPNDDLYIWDGKSGVVMMLHPLDDSRNAPPEEIINCRCSAFPNII